MKSLISALFSAVLIFSTAPAFANAHQHHGHSEHQATYDCPMHPEVVGEKGDSCPKCGMDLEPTNKHAQKKHCPSAQQDESCDKCDKHQGKKHCPSANKDESCAKCDRHNGHNGKKHCPNSQKSHANHSNENLAQTANYDCPMHPEVVGEKGDSCPKCGMDLEPANTHKAHQHH
ncbi:heavy metal-binding domain-containing protein [Shewanella marina]|uniref:heavy metal-binding domain-containing protein n=1 Tax=Shewanella marina TaxID=487319 RepID=UPI0004708921|nr:heavy metal-binding domain-containing protein [Shewanella marina]